MESAEKNRDDVRLSRLPLYGGAFGLHAEGEREYPDEWDYNMRMYSDLMPALRKYNVTCCLENLFTRWRGKIMEGVCSNADEAVRYVDTLNRWRARSCSASASTSATPI